MDIEVKMPDLATTEAKITIIEWQVEPGQKIKRGQVLLEVETDKANMEVESVASGKVKELLAQRGESVEVGQVIALIEKEGKAPAAKPAEVEQAPKPGDEQKSSTAVAPRVQSPAHIPPRAGGMFARNREAAQAQQREKPAVQAPTLSTIQRIVGERMRKSKQTIPHYYLQTSINAERMIATRKAAKQKVVWDAFFVKGVSKAFKKFDRMCCRIENDRLVCQSTDAINVAASIDDDLYVVGVDNPATKSVEQISDQILSQIEQIRDGSAQAKKIQSANITISNLGSANIEVFTAVINPPEASILAVGKVKPQAVVQENKIIVQNRVSVVLSVDHRIANGKYAGDFLSAVVEELEKA